MKLDSLVRCVGFAACAMAAAECVAVSPLDELMPVPKRIERMGGEVPVSAFGNMNVVTGYVAGVPHLVEAESYELTISGAGVTVKAPTEKGVRYAKTTLDQLKALADGGKVEACRIADWPTT